MRSIFHKVQKRHNFKSPIQTEIGEVTVDANAIKDSLSHTMYQNKLDAVQALREVLENGAYLGDAPDKDGKPITNYYFAAPVMIGDEKKIVFVRTIASEGRSNRFYVHEVFTEDEIKKIRSLQTDATLDKSSRLYRNAPDFYRNIIAEVMNVKPGSESLSDSRYLDAVRRGDMESAQQMVNQAAEKAGYLPDSDYRMSHQAPGMDDTPSAEKMTDGGNFSLLEIAQGFSPQPNDYFDNPRAYMYDNKSGIESGTVLASAIRKIKSQSNVFTEIPTVTVYRAVPKSLKEGGTRNADWVTPSRSYAEDHGEGVLEGDYRIMEQEVRADHLWWDGNDVREWGVDDGNTYAYKNTLNNTKLLDPVTYDDDGEIIPLSKRFKSQNPDIRFSLADELGGNADDLISMIRPFVGPELTRDNKEYIEFFKKKGADVTDEKAIEYAREARNLNRAEIRKRADKRRDDWLYNNIPLWRDVTDFTGTTDFRIRPAYRFQGEAFSGTFISAEYVKYSEKKGDGKLSDKQKMSREAKRQDKLKNAKGFHSDELAEAVARKQGRDPLEVEQEIIDFFRDLKKPDLYRLYTDWKKEHAIGSKGEESRRTREKESD